MKCIRGIYEIRNIKNNKVYIGSSKNIENRWKQHLYMLKNNKHHSVYLQNAWNKYGESNFSFSTIEIVKDENDLFDAEQEWMDSTKCYTSECGYNMSSNSRYVDSSHIDNEVLTKILNTYDKKDLVKIKPQITLYSAETDKEYALKLLNGNYGYIDKDVFLHNLYLYYKEQGQRREYLAECRLFYSGLYFSMKELCQVDYDIAKLLVDNNGIDLMEFDNHQLQSCHNIYISRIIDFKYEITESVDVLNIYTDDRSYEIILSTEL